MKIDNLQVPQGYTKTKTSNASEPGDDFSKLLSGAMTSSKEKNVKEENIVEKVVDSHMEETEVDDDMESMNTLLMFMNIPLFEETPIDIAVLGKEELLDLNNDSSISSLNLLEVDIMNIPKDLTPSIVNKVVAGDNFVLEENIIVPQILVETKLPEDKEVISVNDKTLQNPIDLDKNIGNALEKNIKLEPNHKNISIDNEIMPVVEAKVINIEEMIQTEEVDLSKPMDEKVLDIKKDEAIVENKWINHNLEANRKVNVTNEIIQQPKVISSENIENINNSIIQLMETTTEGNTNVMKVQLYPEELGAVNITLKMEDGKLIAKIFVDDNYVKQLFAGKIEQLNHNLIKQNINVEEIFVELNSNSNPNSESGQNNRSFSNQNKAFKFTDESMEQVTTERTEIDNSELSILA